MADGNISIYRFDASSTWLTIRFVDVSRTITATDITTTNITADNGNFDVITANTANITTVNSTDVNSTNITADNGNFDVITTNTGNITTVNSTDVNSTNVTATEVRADDVINGNDVRFFGAVGDGVTDDTTAFVNAIAANACIFVPAGTWRLTSGINVPTGKCIKGVNGNSSILLFDTADTEMITTSSSVYLSDFQVRYSGVYNVSTIGIKVTSSFNIIQNVRINNSPTPLAKGIEIDGTLTGIGLSSVSLINNFVGVELQALRIIGGTTPTVDETIRITVVGGLYSAENGTAGAVAVIETVNIVREMTLTGMIVRAVSPPVTGVLLSADTPRMKV